MNKGKTAAGPAVLVAGATGLVGRQCVLQLLAHPRAPRVSALVRDPATAGFEPHPRLQVIAADFDWLDRLGARVAAESVICALGTTIGKAGSKEAFRHVDHDLVVAVGRLGLAVGARHFLLVSALGADPQSRVFYNRVKGETEQTVLALGYMATTILRPSLLLGERREFRFGEALAKRFAWLMPGPYAAVAAADVAHALVEAALAPARGVRIVESRDIRRRAAGPAPA